MPALRKLSRIARRNEVAWRYLFNFAPAMKYRRPQFEAESRRILETLNRDGIAITHVSALFGESDPVYADLETAVSRLEADKAGELEALRREANDSATLHKSFLCEMLGPKPEFDANSPFARFALNSRILRIANAYFGMYTRLREYNLWHTFVSSAQARQSQLWHRDREDLLILKVFVYLNDVDEGAGPFTYAPGTHKKGPVQASPASSDENGVQRSTDEQMARLVPADRWIKGMGRRGTIIFADTHGYHKGGHCTRTDRIMYHCMFTSPASESKELMVRRTNPVDADTDELAVALSHHRRRLWLKLPATAKR